MKTLTISGAIRKNKGSKDAHELRKTGNVPCVLYGGKEQVLFSVHEQQFAKLLYTPDAYLVTIDLEGKNVTAIVQDSQFDKITDKVAHVDFIEAVPGKALNVKIPVLTTGSAPGVKKGGKLATKIRQLHVKGIPSDIPEHITLDVSHIDLGESIKVKELEAKYPKIKFLDPHNAAVVAVKMVREVEVAAATPAAGAAATPAAGAAAPAAGAAAPAAAAAPKKDEKPAAAKK